MPTVNNYGDMYKLAKIVDFDVAEFRQSVVTNASNEAVRHAIYELLRFAENCSDRIKGGASTIGSFHYQINIKNRTLSLFTSDASGYISVSLGNFVRPTPIVPGPLIAKLRSTLARIPGFESFSKDYPSRPGFLIAQTVVDPNIMASFQKAIRKFQQNAQA